MATVSTVTAASISSIITNGVTAGVSVGVAVGIVSGLFYLTCAGLRWAGRLRGVAEGDEGEEEEEEEEEADRRALALARERRLNARACVRCRRAFPRSSAILRCGRCRFRICGDCCIQSQTAAPGTCVCISCHREVQLKSGDWFYTQLKKRFGGFGLQSEEEAFLHHNANRALAEEVDPETGKVREFVERLVEALISGGLDNVNINRLYTHPEYQPLPTDLFRVGKASKDGVVAMVGEEDDDGLLCSPSVAHAQLKTLVQQVINEARELPRLGVQQLAGNGMHNKQTDTDVEMENNPIHGKGENEDFTSKTYEEILATAILNKVILQCQRENEWGAIKENGGVDRNRNLLVDRVEVGVQAEVEAGCRMRGDGSGPEGASAEEFAEDEDDDNDNVNFNSFGRWRNSARPFAYRIEEKVEEVMTTYTSDDEENVNALKNDKEDLEIERARTLSSNSSIDEDASLSMMRGLALRNKGAPFPEFGVDIVDDADGDNEGSGDDVFTEEALRNNPTTVVSGVDSWEENWLFQRRRLKMRGALSKGGYPLVPMLVPNPSEDLRARIGDIDAEEISDLSECNDSTEWDVHEHFSRSHRLSSSSASVASDSLSSEPLSDPLLSAAPRLMDESPFEAKNNGLLDFAEAQNHQKDSEYTEDYAAADQRRLAMTPSPMTLEGNDETVTSPVNVLTHVPVPRPRTHVASISRPSVRPMKYISLSNRKPPPSTSKMEMLQPPENAVVYAGKAAHFTLDLWTRFPVEVWWFHEELLLEEDDNHRIFITPSKSSRHSAVEYHLEVFNTDPQTSSGNYSVAAIDSCGNCIWQDFSLSVRSSRRTDFGPEFVVEPSDVTVAQGGEVEFLIEVKGHPEPKVSFWKGASLLHSSLNGYLIERQGGGHWMLRINKIAPIDGGKFVVEARNRIGVATATAEVQVIELETVSPATECLVPDVEEEMRALSSLEESSSVLQNGLQHQAEELRATARRVEEAEGSRDDLSESSIKSGLQTDENEAAPPKPGTIAEREHRKWESAPPIPDNPYSPEKISERLRSLKLRGLDEAGRSRGSGSDTSIDFPEFHSESENSEMALPVLTINCGGKDLNPKKYGRDYYINNTSDSSRDVRHHSSDREQRRQPDRVQHTEIDKQEQDFEARKKDAVVEAKVPQTQKRKTKAEKPSIKNMELTNNHSSSNNLDEERKNSEFALNEKTEEMKPSFKKNIPEHIRDEKQCLSKPHPTNTELSNGSTTNVIHPETVEQNAAHHKYSEHIPTVKTQFPIFNGSNDNRKACANSSPFQTPENSPSLPSVRQLALQFSAAATSGTSNKKPLIRRKNPQKEVIVKQVVETETKVDPPLQVHSLTARSISREFREGLRQSQQTPLGKPVTNTADQPTVWKSPSDEQKYKTDEYDDDKEDNIISSKDSQTFPTETKMLSVDCSFNNTHSYERTPSLDSLIDETNGHLKRGVGGGIAFWERLSPLGAPANKDT